MSASATAKTPSEPSPMPQREARQRVGPIVEALAAHYRIEGAGSRQPEPLEELAQALLGEGVPRKEAARARRELGRAFVDWNEVRISRPGEVAAAIRPMPEALERAERLVAALRSIFAARGSVSLAFLHEVSPKEAEEFLDGIQGLGRQARARVLLHALGLPAVPATPPLLRVAARLGFIEPTDTPDAAVERLEKIVPRSQMALFHALLHEHGRRACLVNAPRCGRCPVRTLCPSAADRPRATPRRKKTPVASEGNRP